MIVKCKLNTGKELREYENLTLLPEQFGRFGVSEYTKYDFSIGEEFFVVGMILSDNNLHYLINSGRVVGTYPYQLFEIIDSRLPSSWHFNTLQNNSTQALWGYYEWCFDNQEHYQNLIEMEESAHLRFFSKKIEFEVELANKAL